MTRDTDLPNDLELLETEGQVVPWGVALVNPHRDLEIGDRTIRVAIIDSGVYVDHPNLVGRVITQHDILHTGDYSAFDDVGHGTAIAGIIAATDGDTGIVGISQNVELYSVSVSAADGTVNRQNFISGIEWAIENNVDIINASLGFPRDSAELREVVDRAIEQGIVVVAASGNTNGLNALFPARYEHVISVGSINESLEIPSMSAIGKIDFVAPGVNILSLTPDGGYDLFNGSSFAVAFVTGVVAEYLSNNDIPRTERRQAVIFEYLVYISMPLNDDKERVGNGVPIIPERCDLNE